MAIVAAVDRSDRALDVIEEADELAKAFDETVHVVHVLNRSEFVDLGRTKAQEGDAVDMEEVRRAARNIAAEVATDLESSLVAVGLVGDPGSQIVKYAIENDVRYIVAASRKKSPAGKAIFGSVAQSLILNADCPVVTTITQEDSNAS